MSYLNYILTSMNPFSMGMDDYREEREVVGLDDIPTLREFYDHFGVRATKGGRARHVYPFDEGLLGKVSLWQGDITTLEVDAIVNAANKSLRGGGGVDGAIHAAAGPGLRKECIKLRGAKTSQSKITRGHLLPAKHVIHTVGPDCRISPNMQRNAENLAYCYHGCLSLAVANNLKTLAFCSISTGVYGFPMREATNIALEVTREFLSGPHGHELDRVIFTVFSDRDYDTYEELLPNYFPPPPSDDPDPDTELAEGEDLSEGRPAHHGAEGSANRAAAHDEEDDDGEEEGEEDASEDDDMAYRPEPNREVLYARTGRDAGPSNPFATYPARPGDEDDEENEDKDEDVEEDDDEDILYGVESIEEADDAPKSSSLPPSKHGKEYGAMVFEPGTDDEESDDEPEPRTSVVDKGKQAVKMDQSGGLSTRTAAHEREGENKDESVDMVFEAYPTLETDDKPNTRTSVVDVKKMDQETEPSTPPAAWHKDVVYEAETADEPENQTSVVDEVKQAVKEDVDFPVTVA